MRGNARVQKNVPGEPLPDDPAGEWQPGQPWPDDTADAWQAGHPWPPETEAEGSHAIYGLGNTGDESEGSDRTPAAFLVDESEEEEEEEEIDECAIDMAPYKWRHIYVAP